MDYHPRSRVLPALWWKEDGREACWRHRCRRVVTHELIRDFCQANNAAHAGEESDEDPLAAALAQERSAAAHARSAELGAAIDPDGGIADDSRRFSYYALEGATGAVRWRHDVRIATRARASWGVICMLSLPVHDFPICCLSADTSFCVQCVDNNQTCARQTVMLLYHCLQPDAGSFQARPRAKAFGTVRRGPPSTAMRRTWRTRCSRSTTCAWTRGRWRGGTMATRPAATFASRCSACCRTGARTWQSS